MYLCKSCQEKQRHTLVCQAFTTYSCDSCKNYFNHHNTGIPVICNGCAVTQNKCQKCNTFIKE